MGAVCWLFIAVFGPTNSALNLEKAD